MDQCFSSHSLHNDEIDRGKHVPSADEAWSGQQWCHRAVLASWHAVAKENADLYFYLKFDEMDLIDREERDLHSVIA